MVQCPHPMHFFLLLQLQLPKLNSIWHDYLRNASASLLLSFHPTRHFPCRSFCNRCAYRWWSAPQGQRVAEGDFQSNLRPPVTSFVAIQKCLHSCDKMCSLTLAMSWPQPSVRHSTRKEKDTTCSEIRSSHGLSCCMLHWSPTLAWRREKEEDRKKTSICPSGRSIGGISFN